MYSPGGMTAAPAFSPQSSFCMGRLFVLWIVVCIVVNNKKARDGTAPLGLEAGNDDAPVKFDKCPALLNVAADSFVHFVV
jgi:hypothetical protein